MASTTESPFTKEDLDLAVEITKRVLKAKLGRLKTTIVQNFHEAIDPDLRLAGRIREQYNALIKANFSHDEAMEYTGKSVSRTTEAVLRSLQKTEVKEEK